MSFTARLDVGEKDEVVTVAALPPACLAVGLEGELCGKVLLSATAPGGVEPCLVVLNEGARLVLRGEHTHLGRLRVRLLRPSERVALTPERP